MKISVVAKSVEVQGLTRKQLRAIEMRLGVFLDNPLKPLRTGKQQFAVYDEDEVFVKDIVAAEMKFKEDELVKMIQALFVK